MIDIKLIRDNPNQVIERLKIKNYEANDIVLEILKLDAELRQKKHELEQLIAQKNTASKELGLLKQQLRKLGNFDALPEAEQKKYQEIQSQSISVETKIALLESPISQFELKTIDSLERERMNLILKLPNLPSEKVPKGKTPEDNEVVRTGGTRPTLYKGAVPHWELTKKYDLIDFELGNKITGSGFPVYKGKGAKLQRALIQYFLEYNTKAGYTEYQPPLMVNDASAFGTGQLPDKEGQMYFVTEDNFYLIPTSEVPLTNLYRDVILKENELPVKMTAYTPCFRREAGSYGKDVRGLNRLHQFDKVEIVQLVHPDRSYEVLEEMVAHVEKLLQSLELHYRVLRLCGGDMSFASALTYDFEVYSAAQERWLEVSSVSNFETFQTHRMKMRFKDEKGKSQFAHSLNGSSLALPRIVACLLENNQDENGIKLPVVLHGYFGGEMI